MAIANMLKTRRKTKIAALLLVLGAGSFSGFRYYKSRAGHPPEEEGSEIALVKKGDIEKRFRELGDIAARSSVNVASKVSGRVIELAVKEGDRVLAEQKLAVIQPGKTGAERFLPSTVNAPIAGVVLGYVKDPEKNSAAAADFVEIGDYVTGLFESPNPTYLMTIADMREVVVKLKINEMDILKLQEKMPVEVGVDALPEEKFPALVNMISPLAEREQRGGKFFRVEVLLKRNDPRLRAGMTARVDALLEKRAGVLTMPLSALFEEKGRELVYLEVKDGKPKQVAVKTGMRSETDIELLAGPAEGDRLLTEKPVDFVALPPEAGAPGGRIADAGEARASHRQARRMRRSGS